MGDWLGVPAAFVAWSFALYVFAVAPKTIAARFLIAMLVVDGIAVISSFYNPGHLESWLNNPGIPWDHIHQASDWALVALYLPFIGMTLRTPLVSPLKLKSTRITILSFGAVATASIFFLAEPLRLALRPAFYIVISISLAWHVAYAIVRY